MATENKFNLETLTPLPVSQVLIVGSLLPDVFIETPHKGRVQIPLRKEHYPFIFGAVTQTDSHAKELIKQIRIYTDNAYEYLMDEWLKTIK